jgi:hypothetical protein
VDALPDDSAPSYLLRDRLHPARVSESHRRPRRTAPPPYPSSLLRVLPRGTHSPVPRQGCAPWSANRAARTRQGHPNSRSRWPPPSLHPTGGLTHPNPFTTLGPPRVGRLRPTLRSFPTWWALRPWPPGAGRATSDQLSRLPRARLGLSRERGAVINRVG